MKAKRIAESPRAFDPLRVGQRVRVIKQRHIPGRPVLSVDAWVDEVTEGVICDFKRVDGGVTIELSQDAGDPTYFTIGISPLGPLLNHNGTAVKILAEPSDPPV